jgi:hypothetical protein
MSEKSFSGWRAPLLFRGFEREKRLPVSSPAQLSNVETGFISCFATKGERLVHSSRGNAGTPLIVVNS